MALDIYFLPEPTFITDKVEYLALAEPRPVPFDAIWRLIYSAPTFVGQLVDDAVKSGAQVDEADLIVPPSVSNPRL